MDITSYLGGASFGQDTSGYFKLSVIGGLAVKAPDGMFYSYVQEDKDNPAKDHLFVVNDFLTFDVADDLIYRVPLPVEKVSRGNLIITSLDPFYAVFARGGVDPTNGQLSVLDPVDNTEADYIQPTNLLNIALNIRFFTQVVSLVSVSGLGAGAPGGITFDNKLLPLLLLLGDKTDDGLAKFLILQALSGGTLGGFDNKLLPLLLLLDDKTDDGLAKFLILQALSGGTLGGNTPEINNLLPLLLLGHKGGKGDLREILLLTQALEEEGEPEEGTKGGSGV